MTPPQHATKRVFLALQNVAHFVNPWTPMKLWLAASSILLAAACVSETHRGGRQEPDAAVGDDAACAQPQTFFEDHDGDGHGDMALSVQACTQPAGAVAVGDDCDDTDAERHPGAADVCDGVDNDCSAATAETCPAGCTAVRRPAPDQQHIYLFCSQATGWVAASANCATAGAGFHLAEIDSQAENDFIRTTANSLLGAVDVHIGANDRAVENSWVWDGGELFWTGGPGGSAFMGRFQAWLTGQEPNAADGNGNGADCGELRTDSKWYDSNCNDNQRYVCRQ